MGFPLAAIASTLATPAAISHPMIQGGRHHNRSPFLFSTTSADEFDEAEEWCRANLKGRWCVEKRIIHIRSPNYRMRIKFFRIWDSTDAVHFRLRWIG